MPFRRVGYSHLGTPMPSRRMFVFSGTSRNRTDRRSPRFRAWSWPLYEFAYRAIERRPRWDLNPRPSP